MFSVYMKYICDIKFLFNKPYDKTILFPTYINRKKINESDIIKRIESRNST